jgi:hypothetical protein
MPTWARERMSAESDNDRQADDMSGEARFRESRMPTWARERMSAESDISSAESGRASSAWR